LRVIPFDDHVTLNRADGHDGAFEVQAVDIGDAAPISGSRAPSSTYGYRL
jgi:hypothetical protein